MRLADYGRLAARESRRSRGRIALFMGCIAVGVAAVVLVGGLSAGVAEGIRSEGRRLMAADVVVEARRELPSSLDDVVARFTSDAGWASGSVERADVREFVSVVLAPGTQSSHLAELKAVAGNYPFYGGLKLDPPRALSDLLGDDTVVAAPELLERLGLKVGDNLTVGGAPFRIAGTVLEEPDKLSISFTLGPRVFLSQAGLQRTALIGLGSRVEYRALFKLPAGATAEDATRLERALRDASETDSLRVRTFADAQPALRRSFDRVGRYLGLVGLLSLLVGGVGVAQVARAWLASRMDDVAIIRCIGATPREVVTLYLLQVVVLAVLASAVGATLGTALHWLTPRVMAGIVPAGLVNPWQPGIAWRGVALGVAVAVLFTFPLLVALRRVPPVRVLRRDAEPVRSGWVVQGVGGLLVLVGVWAAAVAQAESIRYGTYFAGGLIVAVALLALAAASVSRVARLLPRDAGGVRLRHGLAHLGRPGAATVGAIVAMGLGVTFVFATWLVERHLNDQLRAELPAEAPSTFFLDVQPDQWSRVESILSAAGAQGIESRPIVTARFAAVDGVPVAQLTERRRNEQRAEQRDDRRGESRDRGGRPRSGRWALTREQRLTYGRDLPRGNRVVAGSFPAGPGVPNGVSLEQNYARDLGVGVGSLLKFDVQGVPVDMVVTSLRTVDWRTMGMNFFLFAEPGPLDEAPQIRLATARISPAEQSRVQAAIVSEFPNVTVIQIRDVMDKVMAVLRNIGVGIRALGAFTVVSGVIVLGGTVAATQARRAREVALLKAVGMTRRDVVTVFSIEYGLTGCVAAAVGVAAGSLLAWAVLTRLMDLDWAPSATEVVGAISATVVLSVIAGLVASARALQAKPLEVLRSD